MKISKRGREIFFKNHEIYETFIRENFSTHLHFYVTIVVYFCTVKYLNTSGQYLNTGTVFGI